MIILKKELFIIIIITGIYIVYITVYFLCKYALFFTVISEIYCHSKHRCHYRNIVIFLTLKYKMKAIKHIFIL